MYGLPAVSSGRCVPYVSAQRCRATPLLELPLLGRQAEQLAPGHTQLVETGFRPRPPDSGARPSGSVCKVETVLPVSGW